MAPQAAARCTAAVNGVVLVLYVVYLPTNLFGESYLVTHVARRHFQPNLVYRKRRRDAEPPRPLPPPPSPYAEDRRHPTGYWVVRCGRPFSLTSCLVDTPLLLVASSTTHDQFSGLRGTAHPTVLALRLPWLLPGGPGLATGRQPVPSGPFGNLWPPASPLCPLPLSGLSSCFLTAKERTAVATMQGDLLIL